MAINLRLSSLIPNGLIIDSTAENERGIVVSARAKADEQACPRCGMLSSRIHSRYVRTAADLPCAGKKVELRLLTRRFVCNTPFCQRQIFAERFEGIVAERARRTSRLECIVHHLGLALGGRPAACFAKRLMVPVSNDTEADWPFAVVCDLMGTEIDDHKEIRVVSRDRGCSAWSGSLLKMRAPWTSIGSWRHRV